MCVQQQVCSAGSDPTFCACLVASGTLRHDEQPNLHDVVYGSRASGYVYSRLLIYACTSSNCTCISGDVVLISNPTTPPINASAIPPFDNAAASSYIQILLSSYTFETAIYTFYKVCALWLFPACCILLLFIGSRRFSMVFSRVAGRLARLRDPAQPSARRPEQHCGL